MQMFRGKKEPKLGEVITTIPKIDFNEEPVEYKNQSFTVQKDTEVIHGEVEGGTEINCYLMDNQSEFTEKRRHSFSLKQMFDDVAEKNTDLGAQSAQQVKITAMSFDERKTCCNQGGSRTQHCGHSRGDASTGACDSEGTENGGCPIASVH